MLNIPAHCCWGGCEMHLMDFFRQIDYSCAKVILAVNRDLFSERLQKEGIPVEVKLFSFMPEKNNPSLFFPVRRFLRDLKADKVIFVHNGFLQFLWPSFLAAWFVARKQVFTFDVLGAPDLERIPSRKHWGVIPGMGLWWCRQTFLVRLRAKLVKRMLAASQEVKDRMVKYYGYPAQKIEVRYHGTDCQLFRPDPDVRSRVRQREQVSQTDKVILTVARLSPQKRIDRLIAAFAEIARTQKDVILLIVGDGELEESVKQQAVTCGFNGRIRFLGYRADSVDFHKAADIFVLSSDNEGFPRVIIESMAVGNLVVSTDVPGVDVVVQNGETGILVEKSVAGVVGGLEKVLALTNEGAAEMSRKARQLIQDKYELGRAVEEAMTVVEVPVRPR